MDRRTLNLSSDKVVSNDHSVTELSIAPRKEKQDDWLQGVADLNTLFLTESDMQLVNEKVLAEKLDVSISKLQRDRHLKRGLPFLRIGKLVKYDLDKVFEYLEAISDRK